MERHLHKVLFYDVVSNQRSITRIISISYFKRAQYALFLYNAVTDKYFEIAAVYDSCLWITIKFTFVIKQTVVPRSIGISAKKKLAIVLRFKVSVEFYTYLS